MTAVVIGIIDYGMGNLSSVANAVAAVGAQTRICREPAELDHVRGIILPGVGGFGAAMQHLVEREWDHALDARVRRAGMPFLGICLGMQVLAQRGTEHGEHDGLGWIEGSVVRLDSSHGLRIPHIAWNDVTFHEPDQGMSCGLSEREVYYFVHSFALHETDPAIVKGTCDYGARFVACVQHDNVWATQFHPEKSQHAGLRILANFSARCVRLGA